MDPATTQSIAEEAAKGLPESRGLNYAILVGFIIICFDWLLNFDSEVKLIWHARGIKMELLYLLTRYLPLGYHLPLLLYRFGSYTPSECTTLYKIISSLCSIAALCAALVFTIRTWAVWARGKHITYILFGMYTTTFVSILVCLGLSLSHVSSLSLPLLGCYPVFGSLYLPASFVAGAAFDTADLVLMIVRGASLYWSGRDSRLFKTIYSDGIMFYVYITSVSISNVALLFGQGDYGLILSTIQGDLRSVLACRVILHIRKQFHEPPQSTEYPLTIQSDLRFCSSSRDEENPSGVKQRSHVLIRDTVGQPGNDEF